MKLVSVERQCVHLCDESHDAANYARALSENLDGPNLSFGVESGNARLPLPVGRTWSGTIPRQPVLADMAPSGRQIDASARWRRANVCKGDLSVEAIWSRHPGHAEKRPELDLLAGWRVRW